MAYNILSGNVGESALILSGAFSGAYDGDGTDIINVSHAEQTNADTGRIPYFFGAAPTSQVGEFNLKGNENFTFNQGTNTFSTKTGSFTHLSVSEPLSGNIATTSYLGVDPSGRIVVTSSAGGGSGGGSGQAAGPTGSLQFLTGSNSTSGSVNLLYLTSSNTLVLTGTFDVSGTINANELNINVVNKSVINLEASGSTKFGDTADDTHQFTGSVLINGTIVRDRVSVAATTYSITATNYFIGVQTDTIAAVTTITLPAAATLQNGQSFVIKDEGGAATTYNIKITGSSDNDLIDNTGSIFVESPYGAVNLYTNGNNKFFIY